MKVNIKLLSPEAVVPKYGRTGDCGLDLVATSVTETEMYIEYGTSLAIEIPSGFVGLIYPRSSLSNYDLILANHVGVIDSNFRGEIKFRFKKSKKKDLFVSNIGLVDLNECKYYKIGDRIGQIIIQEIPDIEFTIVEELSDSNRGNGAYGSSGK